MKRWPACNELLPRQLAVGGTGELAQLALVRYPLARGAAGHASVVGVALPVPLIFSRAHWNDT